MSFSRTKLLISFALLGFLIGSISYFAFDWIVTNTVGSMQPVPILEIISSPWFISGIAGSCLSIAVIYASARFAEGK